MPGSSPAAQAGTIRSGALWSGIFAASVGIALVVFGFWFLIIQGPAPTLAPST